MKVSVIMSVYNRQDYISDCILSVLNQSFKDFEFIIVDDGSTDSTIEKIKSFKDDRIKLIINENNVGLTKNLNYALSIAKGEYIARMDDDDICFNERFEKEVEYLDSHKNIFMVCSKAICFGNENKMIFSNPKDCEFYKSMLVLRNSICHSSVMFRNDGFKYNEDFLKSQDFEAWFRIANIERKNIGYINKPLIYFRVHNSQTNVKVQNNYGIKILERNYKFLYGENYDIESNVFKTHLKIIQYDSCITNENEIKDFYDFHRTNSFKKYRYLKPIILFEIEKYCRRKSIKNPLKTKFMCSFLIPSYFKLYLITILGRKKNVGKYLDNINWAKN